MKTSIASLLACALLMGAGPQAPYPNGAPVRNGGAGPAGPAGPAGAAGVDVTDGGLIQGKLTVQSTLQADGGICLNNDGTCTNNLYSFGGFVRSDSNILASSFTGQSGGFTTNSGGHYNDNGYTMPAVQWVNVDAGSSTASHWEVGSCTASSNACPSQTLHFSATPYCICSDTNSTLGACSVTSISSSAVVPKTFGATDVAHWMCFGAN